MPPRRRRARRGPSGRTSRASRRRPASPPRGTPSLHALAGPLPSCVLPILEDRRVRRRTMNGGRSCRGAACCAPTHRVVRPYTCHASRVREGAPFPRLGEQPLREIEPLGELTHLRLEHLHAVLQVLHPSL